MNFDTVKGIVRGDYMTGCLTTVIGAVTGLNREQIILGNSDKTFKAKIALCALRVIINTALAFIILAPLAILAKPLLAIAGVAALVVFVASTILNHDWFKHPGLSALKEELENVKDGAARLAGQVVDQVLHN